MKILQFFEWCAAVMILSAVVLGLGKVAVDQIVYVTSHPAPEMIVRPVTMPEIKMYLEYLRQQDDESSRQAVVVVEAKLRGER